MPQSRLVRVLLPPRVDCFSKFLDLSSDCDCFIGSAISAECAAPRNLPRAFVPHTEFPSRDYRLRSYEGGSFHWAEFFSLDAQGHSSAWVPFLFPPSATHRELFPLEYAIVSLRSIRPAALFLSPHAKTPTPFFPILRSLSFPPLLHTLRDDVTPSGFFYSWVPYDGRFFLRQPHNCFCPISPKVRRRPLPYRLAPGSSRFCQPFYRVETFPRRTLVFPPCLSHPSRRALKRPSFLAARH